MTYMRARKGLLFGMLAMTVLVWRSAPAAAQQPPRWAVTGMAGYAAGELPSSGPDERSGLMLAVRGDRAIARPFVIELGISALLGGDDPAVFPEIAVQIEAGRSAIRPYLGVGAGYALFGSAGSELAFHAASGVRYSASDVWNVRAEVRPRLMPGGWYMVEMTAGVSRTLR